MKKKKIKIFFKIIRWYIICVGIKNNFFAYNCWYNEKFEFIFFWGGGGVKMYICKFIQDINDVIFCLFMSIVMQNLYCIG